MINPLNNLTTALEEIQAAQTENSDVVNNLTKIADEFKLLTIQPWELPDENF